MPTVPHLVKLAIVAVHCCATYADAMAGERHTPKENRPACFGGVAQVLLADQSDPHDLVVAGGKLYWSGAGLQRMDLKTAKVSSVGEPFHGPIIEIGPIDARDVFARTGQDEIVAFDLRTSALRTILPGHLMAPRDFASVSGFPAVDTRYLYFTQDASNVSGRTGDGFARIPRDGRGRPELLGAQPHANGLLAIDGGFVYFIQVLADRTRALARRALVPDAAVQVIALLPPSDRRWFRVPRMTVAGGRVYYPYDWAIWSAPIAGGAQPVRHAELGVDGAADLLVDQRCLYWATDRNIKRLAIDGAPPVVPQIVADEGNYQLASDQLFGRVLATDGQFLYWPDAGGDRLMRTGRDSRSQPPSPAPIAAAVKGGVAFDPPAPPGVAWASECRIHSDCPALPAALPDCPSGDVAAPWSQLEPNAQTSAGRAVRVQGPLILGWRRRGIASNRGGKIRGRCAPGECCRRDPRPLVIGGGEHELRLQSFECAGDDSRLCCNAAAFGQTVIASGTLTRSNDRSWNLSAPNICVVPNP